MLVAEVAAEYVPAMQLVQAEEPAADQVPTPQGEHVAELVAPTVADEVPAPHCVQVAMLVALVADE